MMTGTTVLSYNTLEVAEGITVEEVGNWGTEEKWSYYT